MPAYNEEDIIKGCRRQDRTVQEHLYKQYYSLFLKMCARYAKDIQDAEQLLNDAFLRIFTKIDSYKQSGSFEGWMKRIVVNTCLDYLRSSALKHAMKINMNVDVTTDTSVSVNNDGMTKMEFAALLLCIQSLPVVTRTVFNLFVFEGYPHKQIAEMLDITENTSGWHVHQARKMLQKKIAIVENIDASYATK